MLLDDCLRSVDDVSVVHVSSGQEYVQPAGQPGWAAPFFRLSNPMTQPFLSVFAERLMEPTALSRRQVVSDSAWYGSDYFDQYRRAEGLDDCIICAVPLPGNKSFVSVACLNRGESSLEPFATADCQAAELIHAELRWACVSRPEPAESAPESVRSRPQISVAPRFRKVLVRMLAGDSEKQIARTLGLSRHTIHEYIRALYRELGVCSRAELMARFVIRESPSE